MSPPAQSPLAFTAPLNSSQVYLQFKDLILPSAISLCATFLDLACFTIIGHQETARNMGWQYYIAIPLFMVVAAVFSAIAGSQSSNSSGERSWNLRILCIRGAFGLFPGLNILYHAWWSYVDM